jgi:ribosomal protein S12 methylthiotransferase accessory factor YcaO
MNPGASRYWYETEITFSSTNQPLTKVDTQMPMEHLTPTDKEYWDEKKKQWVKQLTIECQPVPAPKQ